MIKFQITAWKRGEISASQFFRVSDKPWLCEASWLSSHLLEQLAAPYLTDQRNLHHCLTIYLLPPSFAFTISSMAETLKTSFLGSFYWSESQGIKCSTSQGLDLIIYVSHLLSVLWQCDATLCNLAFEPLCFFVKGVITEWQKGLFMAVVDHLVGPLWIMPILWIALLKIATLPETSWSRRHRAICLHWTVEDTAVWKRVSHAGPESRPADAAYCL